MENLIDQVGDYNADDACPKLGNDVFQQVMGEWSGGSRALKFDGNRICLSLRYPDKEIAFLLYSFQDDHSLLRSQIDSHAFNCHLNHVVLTLSFMAYVRRKSDAPIVHLSSRASQ